MIRCYFCQTYLEESYANIHFCVTCQKDFDLNHVSTVVDNSGLLCYAHIYLLGPDYKTVVVPTARHPNFPGVGSLTLETGTKYHVRLHLQEEFTSISKPLNDSYNHIVDVPGFPITPANIRKKLPTYILFS